MPYDQVDDARSIQDVILDKFRSAGHARSLSILLSLVVASMAMVVMLGWLLRQPYLVQLSPNLVPMQFNTALCFVLSAVSLILLSFNNPLHAAVLAAFTGMFAAATGLQYLTGWNLGLDTLFTTPFVTTETSHPGRMAPNTAGLFLLFSAFILVSLAPARARIRSLFATPIASVMLGYCIFVLIGYAGSLEASFKWAELTSMAIQTAICFLLLAAGYLACAWEQGRRHRASGVFPAWSSLAATVALMAIAFGAWHALSDKEDRAVQLELEIAADGMQKGLFLAVDRYVKAFERLVTRYERSGYSDVAFERDANDYFEDQGDLTYALVTSPTGPRAMFRGDGVELRVLSDLNNDHLNPIVNELERKQEYSTTARLVDLEHISKPYLIISRYSSSFSGGVKRVIIFVYDFSEILDLIGAPVKRQGFDFSILTYKDDGDSVVPNATFPDSIQNASASFMLLDTDWRIQIWSDGTEPTMLRSALPETILSLVLLMSLLAGGTVFLLRRAQLQEADAVRLNKTLSEEVEARTRSESELRKLKRQFELILDSAGEGIYGLNLNGVTTFANKAAEQLTGWTREEMSRHKQHALIHHSHANGTAYPQTECPIYATLTDSSVHAVANEVFWHKNGTPFSVEYVSTPIFDDDGNTEGAVVVFRDITLRKQQENELKRINSELSAANKELEAFCYSVSHDLRAPLRAISGFSDILKEDYKSVLDEDGAQYLDRICAAAKRMGRLIDDLLALSRLTRQEMVSQPVDLSDIAQKVVQELRDGDPTRSVDVRIEPGCIALADARLIGAVLQNLLGNAWKFTRQAHSACIEFGRVPSSQPELVRFFVRDNGAGFNMAYEEKLFAPFQRLHTQEEFEGTGIGLAIVQRALHRHNGRIWAESQPGEGATFYFEMPWGT
ncbi:MAG: ATP-binding protein [Alphaproteobacteria bacterium]|nr:ATP-binding protein [Alphaproteobacteria bacterium]